MPWGWHRVSAFGSDHTKVFKYCVPCRRDRLGRMEKMEEVLHVKLTDRIEFDKVKTRTRLLILPRRAVLEHGPIRQIDRHSLTVSQMRETEHDYEHREDELTPIHGHPQSRSFVFVVAFAPPPTALRLRVRVVRFSHTPPGSRILPPRSRLSISFASFLFPFLR